MALVRAFSVVTNLRVDLHSKLTPPLLTRNLVEVDHELGEGGVHQPRRAVDAAVLAGPDNRQYAV